MERTRTKGQRDARASRQGRQTEPARRFQRATARAGGSAWGRRHRQPDPSGAQKLLRGIQGVLPGGGKSAAKRGKLSGGKSSIPVVGGLLTSLSGKKRRGAGRGRKPAMFGLLGAGAAGAAAATAKRRRSSRSAQSQGAETTGVSEAQATSTETWPPVHQPDTPASSEAARDPETHPGEETFQPPDIPGAEDQRG
jgi:hypothetical protein